MVGGHDHGEGGHDGVGDREPAPPASQHGDDRDRHEDGPADMHRWHRRQLVGVEARCVAVDRLVIQDGCVDHSRARQHAGRRHRDQLDAQAQAGESHQGRPPPPVVGPVPDEQPDHAPDQHGEMQDVVIEVPELDEQRMRQKKPLHPGLVRQAHVPLDAPDPARPAQCLIGSERGELACILPERVEGHDEGGLQRNGSDLGERRPAGCPERD